MECLGNIVLYFEMAFGLDLWQHRHERGLCNTSGSFQLVLLDQARFRMHYQVRTFFRRLFGDRDRFGAPSITGLER